MTTVAMYITQNKVTQLSSEIAVTQDQALCKILPPITKLILYVLYIDNYGLYEAFTSLSMVIYICMPAYNVVIRTSD